jgi:hypothetical protein
MSPDDHPHGMDNMSFNAVRQRGDGYPSVGGRSSGKATPLFRSIDALQLVSVLSLIRWVTHV